MHIYIYIYIKISINHKTSLAKLIVCNTLQGMRATIFKRLLPVVKSPNGIKNVEQRGFHKSCITYFMHERHPDVEENRKRIGIVGGAICAGQVIHIY